MREEAVAPEFAPARHPYRWAMLAGVWLLYFSFGLTRTAIAPLVQPIMRDLGMGHAAMGSVLGAWQLVYIGSAIPSGVLLDRLGPRRSLLIATVLIAASGVFRSLAVDSLSLFLAVCVFGLGGPMVSAGAPKVVSLWFTGKERGFAMGVYVTGPAVGAIAAFSLTNSALMPLMGNDWRAVMLAYAAFVAVGGVIWLGIGAHPAARAVERRLAAEPKQPQLEVFRDLLRLSVVRIVLVMSIGFFFFNHAITNWLPEILRAGGMDPVTAGFWASVPTAVGIAGSLMIPRLATPPRRFFILFLLLLSAEGTTVFLHFGAGPLLATGLVLQGIARSSVVTLALLILVETKGVGPKNSGAAGGLFFSAAEIGGVSGPLTLGLLYDLTGGFSAGLYALSGVCAVLILLCFRLRPRIR